MLWKGACHLGSMDYVVKNCLAFVPCSWEVASQALEFSPLLLARLTMRLDNGGLGPTSGKRRGLELYLHNAVWDPRRPGLCLLWLVLICYLLAVMTHGH